MVLCTLAKYDSSIPLQKKKKSAQTTYFCHYSKHCLPFKLENMLTFTVFLMIFFVRFLLWWTSLSSSLNILTFNQATWNRPWVTLQHSQCHRWGNNNCLLFNCFNILLFTRRLPGYQPMILLKPYFEYFSFVYGSYKKLCIA